MTADRKVAGRTPPAAEENVAADDASLTPEELRAVDEVLPPGAGAGDRYADMWPLHR